MTQQDSQCTYNKTLRTVRTTTIAVEKAANITQPECVFVDIRYPACNTVICGLTDSKIFFPHFLLNGTILEKKKLLNIKCVFQFPPQILSEIFSIL